MPTQTYGSWPMVEAVADFYRSGGFVMPFLWVGLLALWYAMGVRTVVLRRAGAAIRAGDPDAPVLLRMGVHRTLVRTIVVLAPLAGLLGTVTGMIETFDSLADMALFSHGGGGIAGGISQALVSTQMGLAVAVPGLIAGRMLDGRHDRLADELEELIERRALESA